MHKHLYTILLTILGALTASSIVSCSGGTPGAWSDIDVDGWRYGSTVTLTPDSAEATDRIALTIRHDHNYGYANLWLEIKYDTPDSTATDTVDVTMADAWGRWKGHGSGVTYLYTDTVTLRHPLRRGGSLHLRHIMRLDTLTEIEQIGIIPLPASKRYKISKHNAI